MPVFLLDSTTCSNLGYFHGPVNVFKRLCLKPFLIGAPGRLRRLSIDFGSDHDLMAGEFEPRIGLCADSSEPGACFGFCLPPSALPLLTLSLSVSLSQK